MEKNKYWVQHPENSSEVVYKMDRLEIKNFKKNNKGVFITTVEFDCHLTTEEELEEYEETKWK